MLKTVSILQDKSRIKQVKKLYNAAFPKEERIPFFFLKHKAKKDGVRFDAVLDGETFVGLQYTVRDGDIVFLFYLAIEQNLRGKGYGTMILNGIKSDFEGCRIILNIEEVNQDSANYRQQLRRKAFYFKNGFEECDLKTKEKKVVYEMLARGGAVSYEEYSALIINYMGERIYKKYYSRYYGKKEN